MINYGGLEPEYSTYEKSKIVIVPVPYDGTSTWGKGADLGPEAILEASANMELYDIETDSEVYRHGIFTAEAVTEDSSAEAMVNSVQTEVGKHLDEGKFVVTLGGEHSITTGPVRAYFEKYPDMCVLQIDAHTDLRQEYLGTKYNHACVMARVQELCPIVQVGIRSMDVEEKPYVDHSRVFFAKDIADGSTAWMDDVIDKLNYNVYLTVDLDGFDPSILPATGTPEPGGLLFYPVLQLLRKLIAKKNLIGFDVMELCPNENSKPSDFLASKLIYQLLSYKFSGIKS